MKFNIKIDINEKCLINKKIEKKKTKKPIIKLKKDLLQIII